MLADKLNSIIAGWDAYGWGQKLGGMLQNGISFAFSFLTTFDWNGLGAKLAGFVNGLLNQVDGAQLGALFASKFTIAIRTLGTFLANLDWAMLGAQISSFAIGFIDALAEAIQVWIGEKSEKGYWICSRPLIGLAFCVPSAASLSRCYHHY